MHLTAVDNIIKIGNAISVGKDLVGMGRDEQGRGLTRCIPAVVTCFFSYTLGLPRQEDRWVGLWDSEEEEGGA